ncbi:MAG: phosphatidate cytidylyltransferase [Lewinellaceae bacterium]|nr:phosphatidate cytidylyltransferase [Lewinellaceae bacterium]
MNGYTIPTPLLWVFAGIFGFLAITTLIFQVLSWKKPTPLLQEMLLRTRSWWFMAAGIALVVMAPPIVGTIIIGYVCFVALREMFSISGFREADRPAMFFAYFAIPVQFYLAYQQNLEVFYYFIPLVMSLSMAFILVLTGSTESIGRSMALTITMLLLTAYLLSHIVLLYNMDIPGYHIGGGGLIIFLVALTGFNDVFQFFWGKLLGKHKILPTVSPNKTWEGFIGGIFSTAGLALGLRFLTPFSIEASAIVGLAIGIMGFGGDVMISAIKRDLRLKDTDDLIPGHGGAMDRLDSILVTAPVFYHLLTFFIPS